MTTPTIRRDSATTSPSPLAPAARLIIAGFAVSYVGTGLVLPLNAIYLSSVLGHAPAAVSLFYVVLPLGGMLGGLGGGRVVDRVGARVVGTVGFVLQAAGWACVPLATSSPLVPVVAAVAGLGAGIASTALRTQLSLVTEPDQRARAFAVRNVVVNLGVAVGALGLAALALLPATPYAALYLADAASFLLFAGILLVWGGDATAARPSTGARGTVDRRVLAGLVGHALTVALALSVVESVLPLLWHELMGVRLAVISSIIAVGTVVSVLVQLPLERLMRRWGPRPRFGLHTVSLLLAWGVGITGTGASGGSLVQTSSLVALIVVLAISECVYQAAFQPRLSDLVRADRLGSTNGWVSVAHNSGTLVGAGGGAAVVLLLPTAAHGYTILLVGACLAGLALQVFAADSRADR